MSENFKIRKFVRKNFNKFIFFFSSIDLILINIFFTLKRSNNSHTLFRKEKKTLPSAKVSKKTERFFVEL